VQALRDRIAIVDPQQVSDFDNMTKKRIDQWSKRQRTAWDGKFDEDSLPLLYRAGTYLPPEKKDLAWATPPTMRNVDAECLATISDVYIRRADGTND
jgi:hypothetical protein